MSKKLIGMLAGVTLLGAGAAFANGGDAQATKDEQAQTSTESQSQSTQSDPVDNQGSLDPNKGDDASGIGGSGSEGTGSATPSSETQGTTSGTASGTTSGEQGTGGAAQGEQELTGKVIKAQGNKLFVDHMGAIVELRTDSKTQFEGDVKKTKDLKEGDEIRASFTVKNQTQNTATSISKSAGTGGSGFEDVGTQDPGQLDNTGSGLEGEGSDQGSGDMSGGQGGSGQEGQGSGALDPSTGMDSSGGIEGSAPDTMGTEPSQDLPTQTGPGADQSSPPVDSSGSGDQSGTQIQ